MTQSPATTDGAVNTNNNNNYKNNNKQKRHDGLRKRVMGFLSLTDSYTQEHHGSHDITLDCA